MKKISDLLKIKKSRPASGPMPDQKTIESVFWSVLEQSAVCVGRADIKEIVYKKKKLFIKTTHPLGANELWRHRQKICRKINDLISDGIVEDLKVG